MEQLVEWCEEEKRSINIVHNCSSDGSWMSSFVSISKGANSTCWERNTVAEAVDAAYEDVCTERELKKS